MIVDCAVYCDGQRLPGSHSLADAWRLSRDDNAFVWLGLYEPTVEEFDDVRAHFDLHELAVEDAIHAHQRPKLELYDDTVLVVLKTAQYVDPEEIVSMGEILLLAGDGFLVAVRHGSASALSDVRRRLEARPEFLRNGPAAVLHGVLDKVVDDYLPAVLGLERDVEEVEFDVFSSERSNPTERIYRLKREVLDFHRAAAPLLPPLQRLAEGRVPIETEGVHEYYRDVYDHLLRINERIDQLRDLLTSILEANLTQVSVRQNEDMRKISAWVAIAAIPTMVAGIYGMNFEHMPELGTRYGYFVVLGLLVIACGNLFAFFKRRGWL